MSLKWWSCGVLLFAHYFSLSQIFIDFSLSNQRLFWSVDSGLTKKYIGYQYIFPLWSYEPQVAFMHERRCQGKHLHSNGVHGVTLSFGV